MRPPDVLQYCDESGLGKCCAAFPDGIPARIYRDGADHRQPIKGDRGIRFVMSDEPGAADRLAAYEASRR